MNSHEGLELNSHEGLELNRAFGHIGDPKIRRAIVDIVRLLSRDGSGQCSE